jgi:hypothetical protein
MHARQLWPQLHTPLERTRHLERHDVRWPFRFDLHRVPLDARSSFAISNSSTSVSIIRKSLSFRHSGVRTIGLKTGAESDAPNPLALRRARGAHAHHTDTLNGVHPVHVRQARCRATHPWPRLHASLFQCPFPSASLHTLVVHGRTRAHSGGMSRVDLARSERKL